MCFVFFLLASEDLRGGGNRYDGAEFDSIRPLAGLEFIKVRDNSESLYQQIKFLNNFFLSLRTNEHKKQKMQNFIKFESVVRCVNSETSSSINHRKQDICKK